jgi:hypothetical protein
MRLSRFILTGLKALNAYKRKNINKVASGLGGYKNVPG